MPADYPGYYHMLDVRYPLHYLNVHAPLWTTSEDGAAAVRLHSMSHRERIVTIWAHHGPYHAARIAALEAVGFEVLPYAYSRTVLGYEFFDLRLPNERVINDCEIHQINPVISFFRTLRELFRARPSVVMPCGYERPEALAAIVYSWLARGVGAHARPVVIFMVDNQTDDKRRGRVVEAIKRFYLKFPDGFCCGGSTHVAYLQSLGVSSRRICTGYNCVSNQRIANLADDLRSRAERPSDYFLTLSRLVAKKNLSAVIKAYSAYLEALPNDATPWSLVIAGDGPLREQLKDQIAAARLGEYVRMIGRVDDFALVVRLYTFARTLIVSSNRNEQWALTVNEAMAAGTPVIVSKQCGCSQHLVEDGANGFLFDGNSAAELAELMVWMHLNQRQLEEMGRMSRKIVSSYSPDRFAHNVLALYQKLASRRSARRGPINLTERSQDSRPPMED